MRLTPYSYTNATDNGTDTTINDFPTTWRSTVRIRPIVPDGQPQYADAGDGQEPNLTGVKIAGAIVEITFTYNGTTVGDGYDILAALFNNKNKNTKTFTLKDLDDSSRSYYVTCRNIGVSKPINRTMIARVALTSELLLTTSATAESTWTNAATGTKSVTIDKGNIEALPIFTVSPTSAGTTGAKYKRFFYTFNYTQKSTPQYHIEITNGGLDTAALVKVLATNTTSSMAGITAGSPANGGTLTNLVSTASFPSNGMVMYDNEQIRYTGKTATTLTGITRGANGSTAASHANPTTVYLSKMAYDGRDIRIYAGDGNGNAIETPYWFGAAVTVAGGPNSTTTKIWIPLFYAVRAIGYLSASITDTDTSLALVADQTLEGVFDTTDGLLLMGSDSTAEIIAYADLVQSTGSVTTLVRGAKGTTAVAHTAGDIVRAIREIWMYYGDPAATAPTYNTAVQYLQKKPVFDLTGTNDQVNYSTFGSSVPGYDAAGEWKWLNSDPLNIYTATATGSAPIVIPSPQANPYTEIGISAIYAGSYGAWYLSVPFGCTSAVASTVNRLNLPANMAYMQIFDGAAKVGSQVVASQGTSWASTATLTCTPSSSGDKVQLYLKNTQVTALARRAAVQVASMVININGSTSDAAWGRPYAALSAEQAVTVSADFTIASTTTGESLRFKFPDMAVGASLTINCLLKTIRYSADNRPAFSSLQRYTPRDEWLRLLQGANTLSFTNNDGSSTAYDVGISWQGRNNTFG